MGLILIVGGLIEYNNNNIIIIPSTIHLVAKFIYREKAGMKNTELAIFHDDDFF